MKLKLKLPKVYHLLGSQRGEYLQDERIPCHEGTGDEVCIPQCGMLLNVEPFEPWKPDEKRECVFVIIGKHLQ